MAIDTNELYKLREKAFVEARVYISQWCTKLVQHWDMLTQESRSQLPPLPGRTPEELLPSLFKEPFDPAQYEREAAVLQQIQQAMAARAAELNAEAERCLSR